MKQLVKQLVLLATMLPTTVSVMAYDFEFDGICYNIISEEDRTVEVTRENNSSLSNYNNIKNIVIPPKAIYQSKTYTVTRIGNGAFGNCDALTSVTLPDGLQSIGNNAFCNCGLTSVTIPGSLYALEDGAFSGCDALTDIEVDPDNQNYASLDGVLHNKDLSALICYPAGKAGTYNIHNGIISIRDEAFSGCDALTSVTLPDGLQSIGDEAFYYCDALTSVTLPDGLQSIGDKAFYRCDALTSVTLPDGLQSIGDNAFHHYDALTSVTLPDGLQSIGDEAFYYCDALTQVYCKANTPPSVPDIFSNATLMGTLYVPVGCKDEYMAVDPWRNFWTIEEFDFQSSGVENAISDSGISVATDGNTIIVNGEPTERIEVYTTGGQCAYSGTDRTIGNLIKGAYIVKAGNQTFKIIL